MTGAAQGHRVRPARVADAQGCARVYVDAWRTAYAGLVPDRVLLNMSYERQSRQWATAIAGRSGPGKWAGVYVGEAADGAIAGVATCGVSRQPSYGHEGEVFTLYVAEDHQGRGLGRELLCQCFRGLAADGCGSALVWVLAHNPSRFFYAAMGGRKVAEQREKLWGVLLDQEAYGWSDLPDFLTRPGPCSRR